MAITVEELRVEADADTSRADRDIDALERRTDALVRQTRPPLVITADTGAADRSLFRLADSSRMAGREIEATGGRARDASGRFVSLGGAADRAGDGADRAGRKHRSFTSILGDSNTQMRFFSNVVGALKWPVLISGASLGATAITQLAGAAVAAVGALAPLGGLLATIPQGILGLAAGLTAGILGFKGVGDAMKAYTAAEKGVTAASGRSTAAQRALANAQRDVQRATEDLAKARAQYANDVASERLNVSDAVDSEARAVAALERAWEALREAQSGQGAADDAQDAALDLRAAQLGVERAIDSRSDAEERLRLLESGGVEGTAAYRDAQRQLNEALAAGDYAGVAQAQEALARARSEYTEELDDARRAVAETRLAEEQAMVAVERAQRRLAAAQDVTTNSAKRQAEASLDLREAEVALARAQADRQRTQEALAALEVGGVEGSEKVVTALERLAAAEEAVTSAQESLATSAGGASAAQTKLTDAMEKLSPAGRGFVEFLRGEMLPALKGMTTAAQEGLLPGVEQGLRNVMPLLPMVEGHIGNMAGVMGGLVSQAGALVSTWGGDLQTLFTSNEQIMGNLGAGALGVADGFRHIAVAAAPLTEWLSTLVARGGEMFAMWAQTNRENGNLAASFARTRTTVSQLLTIFGNLWGTLGNVLAAARPLTEWMMGEFVRGSAALRAMTEEGTTGFSKMQAWFTGLQGPLTQMVGLFGDILGVLFRVGQNNDLEGLLRLIRSDFVPALEGLLASASGAFAKNLIKLLSEFTTLFGTLMGHSGALTNFVAILGFFVKQMNWIAENVPGGSAAIGSLVTTMGLLKTFKLTTTLSSMLGLSGSGGLIELVGRAKGSISLMSTSFQVLRAEGVSTGASLLGSLGAAFPKLGAAASAAWGIIAAHPFIAIGVAAALIVGLIIANWDKVGPFFKAIWEGIKDVASSVLNWIKDNWDLLLIFTGPIGIAILIWRRFGDDIVDVIGGAISGVMDFFGRLPGMIVGLFGNAGSWLLNAGRSILVGLWNGVAAVMGWLWEQIRSIPRGIVSLLNFYDTMLQAGRNLIVGIWNGLASMAGWIFNKVWNFAVDYIYNPIKNALGWLWPGSPSRAGIEIGKGLTSGIELGIKSTMGAVTGAGAAVNSALADIGGDGLAVSATATGVPGSAAEGTGGTTYHFEINEVAPGEGRVIANEAMFLSRGSRLRG